MADRGNIPNSPACGQWETLLADALDGLLQPEDEAVFSSHMASCAACTAMFEEARRGREWLEFLSPEPEVPEGLLDKILAQTGPGHTSEYKLATAGDVVSMPIPAWQRPGMMGRIRRFAEPRLLMTAAMAFFSIALTLNMTGVRLTDLRISNLRPSAVRSFMERRLTMASTPIIRYYDHLRLVYEVESRVKEMRRNSQLQQQQNQTQPALPGESKQIPNRKDGGSRVDPPQQSGAPALKDSDYLETSVTFHDRQDPRGIEVDGLGNQSAHSGGCSLTPGSEMAVREGSTVWTA
ncbi:anti-sigma factor family protein [Occallatibacter savannae]|uniref:anti-sigma factor family protein n=1 Tax=Occallatibacter savannae TaxID=1002691 RepID=UPI000D686D22|nr:zf-HC2 domain-containing protein [Occallatibacter savannae]